MHRRTILGGVAALVLLAVAAGCGGDGDESAATTGTTTAETTGSTTTEAMETTESTETTETTAPMPKTKTVAIVVRDGRPQGGIRRATVEQGTRVTIAVTSDVPDEVHVHGYDLAREVENGTARITFVADIPGRFEIELEGRGLQIGDLEVRP